MSRFSAVYVANMSIPVIISIACIGFQLCSVVAEAAPSTIIERLPHISEVKADYFNAADTLWQRIEQIGQNASNTQSDPAIINETINSALNAHANVFVGNTFETNSYWRLYLLFGIESLRDQLTAINDTLDEARAHLYGADNRIIFNTLDIEQWTRDSMFRRLTENMDGLFQLSIQHSDSVFQHIQNEAKCCLKYVNYIISEVQLVREYYANVGKALLRGHAMMQLAFMLMTLSAHRDTRAIAYDQRTQFRERYDKFQTGMQSMLNAASKDLWKCNPNPYLNSRSFYTSITNFMQGYIDNEVNLNADGQCGGTCHNYASARNYNCQNGTLCGHSNFQKTTCSGDIFDCDTLGANGVACLTTDEWENRRYNYVRFNNGSMNGHNVMCFKAEQTKLATLTLLEENQCSNCFCYCDEPGDKSDRYFSLHAQTSNITANKIITGVALKKIDRVIQFIISERELLPFGYVNVTGRRSRTWIYSDESVNLLRDGRNGIDYHTLTRMQRSINLDTITLPLHQVVTGIRFQLNNENRLGLEIRATDFDYETGKLSNLDNSQWIGDSTDERNEILIENPDSPTRTTNLQDPFESQHKFVVFRATDIKKDLAQTTVPFIETVNIEANEPRPLSGVGLYYKGEAGYGGYIAVKLISYDKQAIDPK